MVRNLERRSFLKQAAAVGLGLAVPLGHAFAATTASTAASGPYGGPYWLMVHAGGGWDPLFCSDPKANAQFNMVTQSIGQVGNISFADNNPDPVTLLGAMQADAASYAGYFMSNRLFFQRNGAKACVLNGINTGTNNHDSGTRNTWSGQTDGYPALGAVIASTYGASQPLAFISSGGYDTTLDLVALSRVSGAQDIGRIARPNLQNYQDPNSYFQLPAAITRMQAAQSARLQRQQASSMMVRELRSLAALGLARNGANNLSALTVPTTQHQLPVGLGDLANMMAQTDLIYSAFSSGVAVSATMSLGGFDTHGNHDTNHSIQLAKLLGGIDYILAQLEATGLADRTYVVVGSEFGRGPLYNVTNGKDHWPVTSMMVFGPNVTGNRVVGATDDQVQPLTLDEKTLQPNPAGFSLTPTLINKTLRKLAGVEGSVADAEYPLAGADVSLFA